MLEEDFCSFEVAKLLKEKGFDIPLNYFYNSDGRRCYATSYNWNQTTGDFQDYSCPTHQMAIAWLREVHNIFIQISAVLQDQPFGLHYRPSIQDYHAYARHDNFIEYVTYEEAVEAALKYSLKNLI